MAARFDVVYVSPHPDDAVFSTGGSIALDAGAGLRVAVATLFSAGSDAATSDERRREDRAAVERLGATPIDLGLREAPARDARLARPGRLFRPLDADATPLVEELREALLSVAGGAPIVAPLGVGHHCDHQLAWAACAPLDGASFYEDLPYALCSPLAPRRLAEIGSAAAPSSWLIDLLRVARWWAGRPLLGRLGLLAPFAGLTVGRAQLRRAPEARATPLAEERRDVSAAAGDKLAALAAYTSQWPLFYRSLEEWRSALAAHARRLGAATLIERRFRIVNERIP